MAKNMYQEGYRQAIDDFTGGKKEKLNKLKNLIPMVAMGKEKEADFIRGYKEGYAECQYQTMQKEVAERLQRDTKAPSQSQARSQPRVEELRRLRERRRDEPEHEPER